MLKWCIMFFSIQFSKWHMSTHLLPNQPSFASHSLAKTRVAWHSPLERAYPRNMKSFGKNKGMKRVWKSLEEYLVQNLLGQPPKPKMLAEEQLQLFQVTVFFGISRHAPNLPCRLSLSTLRSRGTGSKNTGAGEGLKKLQGSRIAPWITRPWSWMFCWSRFVLAFCRPQAPRWAMPPRKTFESGCKWPLQ